uniref:CX domain-containing protein n=1 Tax=Heterorhabditis bacteriophora TaxID=37862 RepID=A0A1I7X2S4_HETBA
MSFWSTLRHLIFFRLNSRPYFWGTSYYESHVNNSKICTVLLNATDDDKLMTLQFENGTKPTEIVYGCQDWEYCSDFDCENIIGNIIKIALVSLLAALLFAYIIYRIKRNQRMSRKAIATTTVAQTYSTKTQVSRTQTQSSEVADGCKENKQTTETQKPPEANVESVRKLRPPGGRLPPLEKPS